MVKDADSDGDGTISFEEFICMMSEQPDDDAEIDQELLKNMFRKFDKDRSGLISREELRAAVKELNSKICEDELEEIINDANFDSNGQLNFDNFVTILTK